MKKGFIISIILSLGLHVHAQVKLGLSGGVNLTSVSLYTGELGDVETTPRFGFHAGLGTELPIDKGFSVIGEFKMRGENYALDVPAIYGEQYEGYDRYSVFSLQVPLRVCYTFSNVRVFGGGYYSYLVDTQNKNRVEYAYTKSLKNSGLEPEELLLDQKDVVQQAFPLKSHAPFDVGPLVGVGYYNDNYSMDLIYSKSMVNRIPKEVSASFGSHNLNSQTISLGFFFYL